MELSGRHVVVTGAGRGIGEALVRRFHADGARVVLADLPSDRLHEVADALDRERPGSALAVVADVASEAGNVALIGAARDHFGAIDLFFANAGVGAGSDVLHATEADWEISFAVNVHAHRWAVKHLLPEWLARGHGYFCSTASAAGLLTQLGSAPYSVSKHAAVAFAEWVSITYGDAGVRVTCLCPQGVNTALLHGGDAPGAGISSATVRAAGVVLEPAEVADSTAAAIAEERFLVLPHPEVHRYAEVRAGDHERWLAGMRRLQARMLGRG